MLCVLCVQFGCAETQSWCEKKSIRMKWCIENERKCKDGIKRLIWMQPCIYNLLPEKEVLISDLVLSFFLLLWLREKNSVRLESRKRFIFIHCAYDLWDIPLAFNPKNVIRLVQIKTRALHYGSFGRGTNSWTLLFWRYFDNCTKSEIRKFNKPIAMKQWCSITFNSYTQTHMHMLLHSLCEMRQ